METLERSTLAGFRILVAVAKADGQIDPAELDILSTAFVGRDELLAEMLQQDIDVDEEVTHLNSEERERVYRSAFALAHIDDRMAHDEVEILEKVWSEGDDNKSLLEEVVGEVWDTVHPAAIRPVADPAKRQDEIDHDTIKYCVISAIIGATPVPGLAIIADAAVVAIQIKLVRDIGQYWGHTIDAKAARSLVAAAAGSAGLRIAVFNLARFVPGWGSAFAAAGSFASTFAMARVANAYFGAGKELSESAMRDLFKTARTDGEAAYKQREGSIEEVRAAHQVEIDALAKQVANKEISPTAYEAKLVDAVDADADRVSD